MNMIMIKLLGLYLMNNDNNVNAYYDKYVNANFVKK